MTQQQHCSCASFEKLEGASVPAYTAMFLEDLGRRDATKKNLFRCRLCGREWERRAPAVETEGTRPTLVRLS